MRSVWPRRVPTSSCSTFAPTFPASAIRWRRRRISTRPSGSSRSSTGAPSRPSSTYATDRRLHKAVASAVDDPRPARHRGGQRRHLSDRARLPGVGLRRRGRRRPGRSAQHRPRGPAAGVGRRLDHRDRLGGGHAAQRGEQPGQRSRRRRIRIGQAVHQPVRGRPRPPGWPRRAFASTPCTRPTATPTCCTARRCTRRFARICRSRPAPTSSGRSPVCRRCRSRRSSPTTSPTRWSTWRPTSRATSPACSWPSTAARC